ncbi:MAG: PLP-dependent cysteine synthase family protein [Planctomycetota bacterium]
MTTVPRHSCASAAIPADLAAFVGATPLLALHYRWRGTPRRVFAKYESLNFTGSVKDRMALHILQCAHQDGSLRPGVPIVEASSGNTGIAFAAIGRALGHPVRIYMPDWMSVERVQLLQAFGAELVPVSREQGGFVGSVRMAAEHAAATGAFAPRQFENQANVEAHAQTTGPEIEEQLGRWGLAPAAFVAGVGTGGTVMGVGRYLRRDGRRVRVHPLEPADSPTLREGHCVGKHRIQGISDEFVPALVDLAALDAIVDVRDGDAILMAQALSRVLGLGVGISSGANVLGAMQVQEEMGGDAVVVTILPDSNKKYLSTDLCRCEPVRPEYLTPHVELEGFCAVR